MSERRRAADTVRLQLPFEREMRARLEELLGALRKYGRHIPPCNPQVTCSCGLDEVLATPDPK